MKNKVYTTHLGFKIFGLLFSLPLLIVSIGVLLIPFVSVPENTIMSEMQDSWPPPDYLLYLLPICFIGIIILALIMLVGSFRKKVVITERSIAITNVFITRKLEFYKIESFYFSGFHICLRAKDHTIKDISINLTGLSGVVDLSKTLRIKLHVLK